MATEPTLQLPDAEFSSVVCFTMLHHVPTPALQDQMFSEAFRVLQPGGAFAGSDGVPSLMFRVMHFGDTCNPDRPRDTAGPVASRGIHRRARSTSSAANNAGGRSNLRDSHSNAVADLGAAVRLAELESGGEDFARDQVAVGARPNLPAAGAPTSQR